MGIGTYQRLIFHKLKLKISATAYNAFVDTAIEHQRCQRDAVSDTRPFVRQADIILVRNDSGEDVHRFGVLAITGSVFSPGSAEFKNRVVLVGSTPTSSPHGRFVIAAEPIKAGGIGAAFASGVCPVQVDVTDDQHGQADTTLSNTEYLTSRYGGAATILWRSGTIGLQWAVVRFANLETVYLNDVDVDEEETDGRVVEVGLKWKEPGERTIVPFVNEKYDQLVNPAIQSGDKVKISLSYDGVAGRIVPNVDDSGIPDELDVSQMVQESEYADPENKLVEVEFDTDAAGEGKLKLQIDDTAVASALADIAPGNADIATAAQSPPINRIMTCTLNSESISVYNLDGRTWNEYPGFDTGEKVAVWRLPSQVDGCDYVGTPLDQYYQYYHEFFCIGTAYGGLDTANLTVEYSLSYSTFGYMENVRTYDGSVWSTKYPGITVGTPVVVARVNAAHQYVGHPVSQNIEAHPSVLRVKATSNPPASTSRSAERVDTNESITVHVHGGNWSAAFPVVKTDDYLWAVRVAIDSDVWYGFPSFDFRVGVGEV